MSRKVVSFTDVQVNALFALQRKFKKQVDSKAGSG